MVNSSLWDMIRSHALTPYDRACSVISTMPLKFLHTITFDPPLSPTRQEAIRVGHVNYMTKIHADVEGSELTSWNGMRYPNLLMFGYGDGVTPQWPRAYCGIWER